MNVKELVNQIRSTEALFNQNELDQSLGEWTRQNRRQELSQALLLLRSDLTDLVEILMAEESNKKVA